MQILLKFMLAMFWLLFVPTASGSVFFRRRSFFSPGESILAGYLLLFSLFEILTIPMMFLNVPLHILTACYGFLSVCLALAGLMVIRTQARSTLSKIPHQLRSTPLIFWGALVLILLQVAILVVYAHLDADDALFVGTATTSVQSDTIFHTNPYTGNLFVRLPRRYILSPFPIFLAVISQLSAGLHPAIMAHTVFPVVFLPMAYLVLYLLSKRWFPENPQAHGTFLFLSVVLTWFSAYSVYNAGDFQMVRIWQGKAILAAILLPYLFYLSLHLLMDRSTEHPWILYLLANVSACLLSSMGIFLAPLLMGIFVFLALLRHRSLRLCLQGLLCALPSAALGIFYILIPVLRRHGWL